MEERNLDQEERKKSVSSFSSDDDYNESLGDSDDADDISEEESDNEESDSLSQETDLQSPLTKFLEDIQNGVDTRESVRRREIDDVCKIRLELLGQYLRSSHEKFEDLLRGWSLAKEKVSSPQELRLALRSQQQLVVQLLEEKKKIINDLQWDLMLAGDHFVKDLMTQTEERDQMMEKMDDQIRNLIERYRSNLTNTENSNQENNATIHATDQQEWERQQKEFYAAELEMLTERRKQVTNYDEKIQCLILENMETQAMVKIEQDANLQLLVREHQKIRASYTMTSLKKTNERYDLEAHQNTRIAGLQTENDDQSHDPEQANQTVKRIRYLSKNYQYNIKQYEHLQGKTKNIAVADEKTYEEMVETVEEEVKQLVDKALEIDSLICKWYQGIPWKRPVVAFTEIPDETLEKVREMLLDEAGILVDEDMDEDEKWESLLTTCCISEMDLPKVANYFIKYSQREAGELCGPLGKSCAKTAAALGTRSTSFLTADLINPNYILPALKSFIKQDVTYLVIMGQQARDKEFWESLGNIVCEEKVKLWEEIERTLKQYLDVLKEVYKLTPEVDILRRQNTELRMQLQKSPSIRSNSEIMKS